MAAMTVVVLGLAGCTDSGDFGRPRPSVWNDNIFPKLGEWSALDRGEQVSPFHLTDNEIELRNRSYRFIMPAHERSWFDRQVQELARTRIIPVAAQSVDSSAYHSSLTGGHYRSAASRYNRLTEDILADRVLIVAFVNVAGKVTEADRTRLKLAARSGDISWQAAADADARVAENEGLVLWVCERVRYRTKSFRYALDNLVVEMPAGEAVRAERAQLGLEEQTALLTGICGTGPFTTEPAKDAGDANALRMVVKYRG
jgi:hypothetical protein